MRFSLRGRKLTRHSGHLFVFTLPFFDCLELIWKLSPKVFCVMSAQMGEGSAGYTSRSSSVADLPLVRPFRLSKVNNHRIILQRLKPEKKKSLKVFFLVSIFYLNEIIKRNSLVSLAIYSDFTAYLVH